MSRACSLATEQRSLRNPTVTYPLEPPLTRGCPITSTDHVQYPVEVSYAYDEVSLNLFDASPCPWFDRWAPLLPPLEPELAMGAGATPLIEVPELTLNDGVEPVYVKDESANPTWSQKDRLARVAIGSAVREDACGVVVSSSGNHGAAVAAYAARADLPAIVFTDPETPPAVIAWMEAYGATVLVVDDSAVRRQAVDRLVSDHGYHPMSTRTPVHTGHPWGMEGYKTIAYELFLQLNGRIPGTVLVPTCFAELLYGVWKGFRELKVLGVVGRTPRMVACEPAVNAPLHAAIESGNEIATVDPAPTEARGIGATTSSYRGLLAIEESEGFTAPFRESEVRWARQQLAHIGLWQEPAGAAGVAGLKAVEDRSQAIEPPVICIGTSSGFKAGATSSGNLVEPEWSAIVGRLREYNVPIHPV